MTITPVRPAATVTGIRHTVALRRDLAVSEDPERRGLMHLTGEGRSGTVGPLTRGVGWAVHALAGGGHTEGELSAVATEAEDESAVLPLQMLLRRLDGAGLLEHTVGSESGTGWGSARLRVTGQGGIGPWPPVDLARPVKLSRFALVRAGEGRMRCETPRGHLAVELEGIGLDLVARLADWVHPAQDAVLAGRWGEQGLRDVLGLLALAGVLTFDGPDEDAETTSAQWAPWSTADLWVHARSQGPGTPGGYGGTFPLRGALEPWPGRAPSAGGGRREFAAPAAPAGGSGASLAEVMDRRRSIREHDDERPVSAEALATLLYRCARTTGVYEAGDHEVCSRPHPNGGALYELEIYPIVTSCRGLDPGVWHYDGHAHALERVAEPSASSEALVATARTSALMEAPPQVLLVVAARFGRVMWKYEGIAYTLVQKHVGVLYQTLYLVATEMGLAPCALGGGDAEAFARATGLDYGLTGSVGAFVVGSRRPGQGSELVPPPGRRAMLQYRFKALDKARQPDELDVAVRLAPPRTWMMLVVVLVVAGALPLWGLFGSLPRLAAGNGVLIHPAGTAVVESTASGQVGDVLVVPGTPVAAGAPLLTVVGDGASRVVPAPFAGVVTDVSTGAGQVVTTGAPVVSLARSSGGGGLAAIAFVSSDVALQVRPGMRVRTDVASAPARYYGTLDGQVTDVGAAPVTEPQVEMLVGNAELARSLVRQDTPVMVRIELVPAPGSPTGYSWSGRSGPPYPLGAETPLEATVRLGDMHPIQLLLGRPES